MSYKTVAIVIPCYRVKNHILDVIARIDPDCGRIYVVDDCCPEQSGALVEKECRDARVTVIKHSVNQGVGGAVMSGYRAALRDGFTVLVKLDGDGQMDPALVAQFVDPILAGEADYTKGNRFFYLENIARMPGIRVFGNAVLSFMAKLSTGYWDLFDPTNGYTAIHAAVASRLPFDKISQRYFFETDMLFRLNTLRAVVVDVPMESLYADEVSNLKIRHVLGEFMVKHVRNLTKRIFYNYYLRDMSIASLELPTGLMLLLGGLSFGVYKWISLRGEGMFASTGTIMLAALPILMGVQLLLAFLNYDITQVPRRIIRRHKKENSQ